MDTLFDAAPDDGLDDATSPGAFYGATATAGVTDPSFAARVAVLLRSRPLTEAATAAVRQDWPPDTYDVATFGLAAIDLVIAQQGFEEEATYADIVVGLTELARKAAPDRPVVEHEDVAMFTLDALLNRAEREAEFAYRISDYSATDTGHQQREVRFRLLVEREDPIRGVTVLNATRDAINALIGGLEFDVEDEQVANEVLLDRQLARGAFDAAERSAARARILSVSLADGLNRLIKDTRRDIRGVMHEWATDLPKRLDDAREHIRHRLDVEHRLHTKISESVGIEDADIAASAGRIAALLDECQRRHESLHHRVITARGVFLDEQNRQSFRPPATGYLPDLQQEVFGPLLALPVETALTVTGQWFTDVAGPRPPRLPRLARLVADLWAVRDQPEPDDGPDDEDELGDRAAPIIGEHVLAAAERAVTAVGLPARLSALIAACLTDEQVPEPDDRQQAAEIVVLAALWCFPSADDDPTESLGGGEMAARLLGDRAATDTDGTVLELPGWTGDDLVVVPYADLLATANPTPVTRLPEQRGPH